MDSKTTKDKNTNIELKTLKEQVERLEKRLTDLGAYTQALFKEFRRHHERRGENDG